MEETEDMREVAECYRVIRVNQDGGARRVTKAIKEHFPEKNAKELATLIDRTAKLFK